MPKMNSVEVFQNVHNEIAIIQDSGSMECDSQQIIVLHPDQVDTVIHWIKTIKEDIEEGDDA